MLVWLLVLLLLCALIYIVYHYIFCQKKQEDIDASYFYKFKI